MLNPGEQGGVINGRGRIPPLRLWTIVVFARAGKKALRAMSGITGSMARAARMDEFAARRSAASSPTARCAFPHVPVCKAQVMGVVQDAIAQKNNAPRGASYQSNDRIVLEEAMSVCETTRPLADNGCTAI